MNKLSNRLHRDYVQAQTKSSDATRRDLSLDLLEARAHIVTLEAGNKKLSAELKRLNQALVAGQAVKAPITTDQAAFMLRMRRVPVGILRRAMNKLTPGNSWSGCSKSLMADWYAKRDSAGFAYERLKGLTLESIEAQCQVIQDLDAQAEAQDQYNPETVRRILAARDAPAERSFSNGEDFLEWLHSDEPSAPSETAGAAPANNS